jgi:hypothetical protein
MSPDSLIRTMRLIRSIPDWRDDPRLAEWHRRLAAEADAIERRSMARAITKRSHPCANGLVAHYATTSGAPPKR